MSEPLFNIVTFGMIQPGADRIEVAENMARLFKTTPDKLQPYFAGGRKIIKSNVDELLAEKYRVALEKAGLVIKIEDAPEEEAVIVTPEEAAKGGISLAEVGADVLTESERPVVEPQPIGDIANLSIAELGADVLTEHPVVEPQVIDDISDISMAEVGADVLTEHPDVKPQPIDDISDISMAEVGADVLTEHPDVEPQPIDDISDISMAEVGADVLVNPKPKVKTDIDTSDIKLVD